MDNTTVCDTGVMSERLGGNSTIIHDGKIRDNESHNVKAVLANTVRRPMFPRGQKWPLQRGGIQQDGAILSSEHGE